MKSLQEMNIQIDRIQPQRGVLYRRLKKILLSSFIIFIVLCCIIFAHRIYSYETQMKNTDLEEYNVLRNEIHFKVATNGDNINSVIKLPKHYTRDGEPVSCIMLFHGSGFYVSDKKWGYSTDGKQNNSSPFDNMISTFVNNGYAVCDINGFSNSIPLKTWGAPRNIEAHYDLYRYISSNYNIDDFYVFGFSMGG